MRSVVSRSGLPGRRRFLLILLILLVTVPVAGKYLYRPRVDRIIISATGFPAAINIENAEAIQNFLQGFRDSVAGGEPEKSYREAKYEFSLYRGNKEEKYLFNDHLSFYQPVKNRQYLASPRLKEILFKAIKDMKQTNSYGEFLDWKEVKKIFSRYANATVIDVETGFEFKVQRRAGSQHADVQPLTADDTAVMKQIFDGQWSWRRRAVIIEVNGRRLAASMNGMPHGAGAIRGNEFPGHFCIHFRGSKVHTSGEADLAHQLMVWKAAGKTQEMLRQAKPEQIMWTFFTAVEQREYRLAAGLIDRPRAGENLPETFGDVIWLNVALAKPGGQGTDTKTGEETGDRVDLPVKISWQGKKTGAHQNVPATLTLVRSGRVFPWLISRESLTPFMP